MLMIMLFFGWFLVLGLVIMMIKSTRISKYCFFIPYIHYIFIFFLFSFSLRIVFIFSFFHFVSDSVSPLLPFSFSPFIFLSSPSPYFLFLRSFCSSYFTLHHAIPDGQASRKSQRYGSIFLARWTRHPLMIRDLLGGRIRTRERIGPTNKSGSCWRMRIRGRRVRRGGRED